MLREAPSNGQQALSIMRMPLDPHSEEEDEEDTHRNFLSRRRLRGMRRQSSPNLGYRRSHDALDSLAIRRHWDFLNDQLGASDAAGASAVKDEEEDENENVALVSKLMSFHSFPSNASETVSGIIGRNYVYEACETYSSHCSRNGRKLESFSDRHCLVIVLPAIRSTLFWASCMDVFN